MRDFQTRFNQFISKYDGTKDTQGLDIYTDFPELYEAFYRKHYDYESLAEIVKEYTELSKGSVVVEGACSSGALLEQFDDDPYETFGFDISPEMLALANENTDATLFRSNLTTFYIPDKIDSLFVLGNSLFHLNKQERQKFFKQAYKNMSNRSTLIFSYMDSNEVIDGKSDAEKYQVGKWTIRRNSITVNETKKIKQLFSLRVSDEHNNVKLQTGVGVEGHSHKPKEIESELKNLGFSNITLLKPEDHTHTITIARKVS